VPTVETSGFGHDLKGFMVGYLAVSLEIASTLFQEGDGFLGDQENAFQVVTPLIAEIRCPLPRSAQGIPNAVNQGEDRPIRVCLGGQQASIKPGGMIGGLSQGFNPA
jgi:hypothetical protein